jgi:hypothetical protein
MQLLIDRGVFLWYTIIIKNKLFKVKVKGEGNMPVYDSYTKTIYINEDTTSLNAENLKYMLYTSGRGGGSYVYFSFGSIKNKAIFTWKELKQIYEEIGLKVVDFEKLRLKDGKKVKELEWNVFEITNENDESSTIHKIEPMKIVPLARFLKETSCKTVQPLRLKKKYIGEPSTHYQVTDHTGKTFKSQAEMAVYYGIAPGLYAKRISRGMSMEEALTTPLRIKREKFYINGKKFNSKKELCDYYNISTDKFNKYVSLGLTAEEIISKYADSDKRISLRYDHKGNRFLSFQDMLEHYNITVSAYYQRMGKLGWTLQETLETPIGGSERIIKECLDHLGNKFSSIKEMLRAHNQKKTVFDNRYKRGWSLADSIMLPAEHDPIKPVDHKGKTYRNSAAMAKAYPVGTYTELRERIEAGMPLEEALMKKAERKYNNHLFPVR